MEKPKHKYNVGDKVYDTWQDEVLTVDQKQFIHGQLYYRLCDGKVVHEERLKA